MASKALSPYISTAVVILIGIIAVSLTTKLLTPALNRAKDSAVISEAFLNLGLIDQTIREVASEGEGSKRTINLKVTEGTYRIDPEKDLINFTYRMKEGLDISGQRNRIKIKRSGKYINLFIVLDKMDIEGSQHFTKGVNPILILHNGTNPVTNYPKIYVGS